MQKLKKDPDFAIRLEHAIAKKYGKETIINPASLWNKEKEAKYLEELRDFYDMGFQENERVEHKGVLISKKLLNRGNETTCGVCDRYTPRAINKLYFLKYDCCYRCYIEYVENRESRWLSGWRPNKGVTKCR